MKYQQLSEMTIMEYCAQKKTLKGDLHQQFIFTRQWTQQKRKLEQINREEKTMKQMNGLPTK